VIAEIDSEPNQFVRLRHILDNQNGANPDVDLFQIVERDGGFNRC
jgi:hypothetical protein